MVLMFLCLRNENVPQISQEKKTDLSIVGEKINCCSLMYYFCNVY